MKTKTILAATILTFAAAAGMPQESRALPVTPPGVEAPAPLATPVHGSIYWRHGSPYYKGYRGFRHRRHGYRYHHGYWFPHSAFSFGIIITPAPRHGPTFQLSWRHYSWCEHRYKSYRRRDNSFQPYHGPRKPCVSPYLRRLR